MGNIPIFEAMASKYDSKERIALSKNTAAMIRQQLKSNSNQLNAIDYGCGTGLVGMHLRDAFKSLLFVDASNNMIDIVKQKLAALDDTHTQSLCLDVEVLPAEQMAADVIFMVQVLLHVRDIHTLLTHLHAALSDNGQLLLVDFDYNENVVSEQVHSGFKHNELIETLTTIGFSNIQMKTFYHGEKLFMNQDASLFILSATKKN